MGPPQGVPIMGKINVAQLSMLESLLLAEWSAEKIRKKRNLQKKHGLPI